MSSDFTTIPVGPQVVQACPALGKGRTIGVWNQDTTNVIQLSRSRTGRPSIPLQPLTPASFSAEQSLYVWGIAGTLDMIVLPDGGSMTASPLQLQQALQPNINTAFTQGIAPGTQQLLNPGVSFRVWGMYAGIMVACLAAYAGGFNDVNCVVSAGGANLEVDVALLNPSQESTDSLCVSFSTPVEVPAGGIGQIVVNNGNTIVNASIRGWGGFYYSIP